MNIEALRYFLVVAEKENITAAANALFISQPHLSRILLTLEKELGKKLLVRGKRKTTLTPDGMLFRSRASEIIQLIEMTKKEISNSDKSLIGDIYVGCSESVAMRFFSLIAKEFQNKHPGIRYHIKTSSTDSLTRLLNEGVIDFAILAGDPDLSKFNHFPVPTYDVWGLLIPKEHDLAKKETITAADLEEVPLLISQELLQYNKLTSWLGKQVDSLHIVATYDLIFNASLMLETGMGCALTMSPLVDTPANEPLVFRPLEPEMVSNLEIAWKSHRVFSAPAQRFLDTIRREINDNAYTQTEYFY